MALRVWLPLNGNLENKGLSNIGNLTVNNWTLNNNGKIGKAYKGNGIYHLPNDILNNTWTIALWVKQDGTWSQYNDILLCKNNAGSDDGQFYFSIAGGSKLNIGINRHAEQYTYNYTFQTNVWYHVAASYDGANYALYLNGSQVAFGTDTSTYDGLSLNLGIGTRSQNNDGTSSWGGSKIINDVRVYDECLSPKQIKEISKGLIAHYKLEGSGANPNLAKNTNTANLSTNVCYQHFQTGGSTREIEYDEYGIPCVKITRDDVAQSGWQYLSYDNFDRTAIKTSTTYTVSMDVKASVSGTISLTGLRNGNATNDMTDTSKSITINGTVNANQWNHLVFNCTTISDFSSISTAAQVIYWYTSTALRNTGVILWIKNVKLEEGNKNTSWIPNIADTAYTALGYDNMIARDVSGNGYNGTVSGTLSYNVDSPRYSGSTVFNGSSRITSEIGSMAWCNFDNLTISTWLNPTTSPSSWSGSVGIQQDGNYTAGKIFAISNFAGKFSVQTDSSAKWVTTQSETLPLNTWSHCVAVLENGTNLKMYLNGNLIKTTTLDWGALTATAADTRLAIGVDLPGGDEYFTGSISDVRVYATALTADDILTLYKTSGIIDNKGNVYAYEFKEE